MSKYTTYTYTVKQHQVNHQKHEETSRICQVGSLALKLVVTIGWKILLHLILFRNVKISLKIPGRIWIVIEICFNRKCCFLLATSKAHPQFQQNPEWRHVGTG